MILKYEISKNSSEFFTVRTLPVLVVFAVFNYFQIQEAKILGWNYWEFLISALTNQYYITYFMIPVFIVFIFKLIDNEQSITLIRYERYFKYFVSLVISFIIIVIIFVTLHFMEILIIGYGLDMTNEWSQVKYQADLMTNLVNVFTDPVKGIFWCLAFLVSGFSLLAVLMKSLQHFLDKRAAVIVVMALYLMGAIGMRTDIDAKVPYLFINNYILLNNAMNVFNDNFHIILYVNGMIFAGMLYSMNNYWNKAVGMPGFDGHMNWYLKKLFTVRNICSFSILFIVMNIANIFRYEELTFIDMVAALFNGHGYGYFNMMDYLWMIVYNGAVIYVMSILIEKEISGQSSIVVIRLRKRSIWINNMMKTGGILIAVYVLLSFLVSLILGIVFNVDFAGVGIWVSGVDVNPIALCVMIFFCKFFELYFCYLLIWAISIYTKKVSAGFFTVQALYFLCIIEYDFVRYLPFGSSSLSRWEMSIGSMGVSFWNAVSILALCNIVMIIILKRVACKRAYNGGF